MCCCFFFIWTPKSYCARSDECSVYFVKELRKISDSVHVNDTPRTVDAIEKHIQALKNNEASNDIEAELLKKCSHPIMIQVIQRITDNMGENFDLPNAWGNSHLRTL